MIDAHQHFWRLGVNDCTWPTPAEAAIHRDFLPGDWAALAPPLGVTGSVLVQSQESARDTDWLLELAEAHDFILGVVGWANLKRGANWPQSPWLKGLRPMVQGYDADWLDDPALDPALSAMADQELVFDALVRPRHLTSLERLALRHPRLSIIVDHGAKPDIAGGELRDWREAMQRLAALPNVACKLSGLLTEAAPGQDAEVARVGEWLFARFGAERLLWGSDWPVVELAGTYAGWLTLARSIVPAEAHDAVFGGNAMRIYQLA
ncbi:MAG: amidohydrolase family protein [Sphingomonas sp.]|uniref:amidohydrolase family protein n=1 Tax=Sphingomonas sp. TaxID=28214 RepID=UPI001B0579D5|nr:amidohydrolase family protein [Sphingomonas sp.]MBO9623839.1 amidohydrolase family protein [Sphingomonas sp.]